MPRAFHGLPGSSGGAAVRPRRHGPQAVGSSQRVDLPFQLQPSGTDGTELVLAFLQSVEPRGAKYISDVRISLQLVYKGVPVECASRIVVEADGASVPAREAWRPDRDARWAIDRAEACRMQHANEPPAGDGSGGGSGFRADFGDDKPADEQVPADCALDPRPRFDKRFEHLAIAKFARPDLERVRKQYSDFQLVEDEPECHRIARVEHPHIAATLWFMGNVDRGEPPAQPGMPGNYH